MLDDYLFNDLQKNWESIYKEKLKFDQLTNEELSSILSLFFLEFIKGNNFANVCYNSIPKLRYLIKKYVLKKNIKYEPHDV